jgi:hypothetical protein
VVSARNRQENHGKKADNILAFKGNQGTLHEDVEVFAADDVA